MNLNLNSRRTISAVVPLLAVGVMAVVGLFLVTRGLGGERRACRRTRARAKTSPAKPGAAKTSPRGGSDQEQPAKSEPAAKPSKQTYVNCVEQATDTAALEKCQALVP